MNKKTSLIAGALAFLLLLFLVMYALSQPHAPAPATVNEPASAEEEAGTTPENIIPEQSGVISGPSPIAVERWEKEARGFIENFAIGYRSYTYGDFSNAETLTSLMAPALKERELDRIAALKASSISRNVTVAAALKGFDVAASDCAKKEMTAVVTLEKKTYDGIQTADRYDIMTIIRADGTTYAGDFEDLVTATATEMLQITAISSDEGWQVVEISTVS